MLETDWLCIGQSGPTVDGRNIDDGWLVDAAETYNPKQKTALIWPFHIDPKPWWVNNFGKVLRLRVEKDASGVSTLWAKLNPNESYMAERRAGQKLFFSMELMPNFAESGRYYLTGLVATDDPASLGTTELQFSKGAESPLVFSAFFESESKRMQEPESDSLIKQLAKFFKTQTKEGQDMTDSAEIQKLSQGLDELKAMFAKLPQAEESTKPEEKPSEMTVLLSRIDLMEEKLVALQKNGGDKATVTPEEFNAFKEKLEAFGNQLSDALKEQPGTDAGQNYGTQDDNSHLY